MRLIENELDPVRGEGVEVIGVEIKGTHEALELIRDLGSKVLLSTSQSELPSVTNPIIAGVMKLQGRLIEQLMSIREDENPDFVFSTIEPNQVERLVNPSSVGFEGRTLRSLVESRTAFH